MILVAHCLDFNVIILRYVCFILFLSAIIGHMSIKSYLTEKLIRAKMKNLPKAQQDMFIKLINENPELFKKIGDEVKALTKGGASEMTATMQVMRKYQNEIQKAMQ